MYPQRKKDDLTDRIAASYLTNKAKKWLVKNFHPKLAKLFHNKLI